MADGISIEINVPDTVFNFYGRRLQNVCNDASARLEAHNLLAQMCDPYVPMQEGILSQNIGVTPNYVRYKQPYAHYQYIGDVYGPNIPIFENGQLVGFFSLPGQKKQPTGARINYSLEMHPLATDHWDQAMMRDKGKEFMEELRAIIIRRYGEMYGG